MSKFNLTARYASSARGRKLARSAAAYRSIHSLKYARQTPNVYHSKAALKLLRRVGGGARISAYTVDGPITVKVLQTIDGDGRVVASITG